MIEWVKIGEFIGGFVGGVGGGVSAYFGHRNNRQLRSPKHAPSDDASIRELMEAVLTFSIYQHERNHDILGSIASNYLMTTAIAQKLDVDMPPLQVIIDSVNARLDRKDQTRRKSDKP